VIGDRAKGTEAQAPTGGLQSPPDMKIYAVVNQKGGVGKTTSVINVGAYLAGNGWRVLVVDMDPQANATSGLGFDKEKLERSMYDLLLGTFQADDVAVAYEPLSNLTLLPAHPDLSGAEVELVNEMAREYRLQKALEPIDGRFDYVFIDCPPSLSLLTINALTAARDGVLIPVQCEYLALEGLSQLMRTLEMVRRYLNEKLTIRGMMMTMYDGRTNLSRQVVEEVRGHFAGKVFRTIIPRNVRRHGVQSFDGRVAEGRRRTDEGRRQGKGRERMTRRRGLGRGLGALIPQGDDAEEGAEPQGERPASGLRTVAIDTIAPNPRQPRSRMDEAALEELAASITEHGLIQPLIVHDEGDGRYVLIAGERRWRAAQRTGMETVPVVVKEASPQTMLEMALIENVQRADLNPLEEATAYRQLIDDFGLTQEQVAQRVGKSRPAVANAVRLLDLPPKIQQAVVEEEISGGHARALLGLPTPEAQMAVMRNILKNGLSVRQTEERVRRLKQGEKSRPRPARRLPPELRNLETQFRQSLGTRVNIQQKGKGGRVVIHYYSDEELQAIYEAIVEE